MTMRKKILAIVFGGVFALSVAVPAFAVPLDKVDICHKGNVISVSGNALPAHVAHGDTLAVAGEACP